MTESVEALVVGAGPVGLFAALNLAQRGVDVLVVEAEDGLGTASKASTFHPSTLGLLADAGVADSFLPLGVVVDELHWRDLSGDTFARIPFALLADVAAYPFRLHAEQTLLTPLLLSEIRKLRPGAVRFGSRCESVEAVQDGVITLVSGAEGSYRVRADYVVAADGAHSKIRSQLGIKFPGAPYESRALRVVTEENLAEHLDGLSGITYIRDEKQSCSLLKMRDHWRLIFRVAGHDSDDAILRPDHVRMLVDRIVPGLAIEFAEVYSNRAHVASRYYESRVVLAGDAAHVTTTAGGMNMNCGLHDAYAIAHVIADALSGGPAQNVIDTAAVRRRVVREAIIPRTEERAAGSDGDALALLRAVESIMNIAADEERALNFVLEASMLDTVPKLRRAR